MDDARVQILVRSEMEGVKESAEEFATKLFVHARGDSDLKRTGNLVGEFIHVKEEMVDAPICALERNGDTPVDVGLDSSCGKTGGPANKFILVQQREEEDASISAEDGEVHSTARVREDSN